MYEGWPLSAALGPSPRERGSPQALQVFIAKIGSIPARAGQPPIGSLRISKDGVHPRASGAARSAFHHTDPMTGPSPRERGSLQALGARWRHMGSIPARAGQPMAAWTTARSHRVHPRASGAASSRVLTRALLRGPSPRERGSLKGKTLQYSASRSIPARAGQPRPLRISCQSPGVHPRASGAASWY